jgi:hypothetical protein
MLDYLIWGLKQVRRHRRLLIMLYLLNLALAVVALWPLHSAMSSFAGHSRLAGPGMAHSFDVIMEFLVYKKDVLPAITPVFVAAFIIYGFSQMFLYGGILSVFMRNRKYEAPYFWGRCGKLFRRLLVLLLCSLPFLAALVLLPQLFKLIKRALWGQDPYQYITFWIGWLVTIVQMAMVLLYNLLYDYAALYLVRNENAGSFAALKYSLLFNAKNFTTTAGLTFIVAGAGLAGLLLYNGLSAMLDFNLAVTVVLLILVQQAFMVFRMLLKLVRYAAQIGFYQNVRLRFETPKE